MNNKYYVLSFLLMIFVLGCNDATKEIESNDVNYKDMPDQICYNMEFVFFDSSSIKNVINSQRARIYNDKKETILDGKVLVRFYDANNKQSGTLNADLVNIDDATKDMIASGNVVVFSDSSKTKLETSELKWKQETGKIYTNVYVKITSPTEIIEGIGLESDESLSNYRIFKVTGIKN